MENIINEGIRKENNIPLPIECLIMPSNAKTEWGTTSHYHEYIELLYVLEGAYEVKVNGAIIKLEEHSMFIIQSWEPHTTRTLGTKQCLLCIKFLPQVLYSSEQSVTELEYSIPYVFENLSKRRKFDAELLKDTFVPYAFQEICEEKAQKHFGYELALRSHVLRIFLWIMRYWHQSAGNPELSISNRNITAMICRTREYVKDHYETATLTDAAKLCGVSYSYFSRIFNTYMKMSFSDYVNMQRIISSVRLLASTDLSITEIALMVGFSTTSYFIQIFKKHKSISPNRFRRLCRSEEDTAIL